MKTITASISAGTVVTLMSMIALVPLPDFAGGTTGVKLAYNIVASNHISDVSEWVIDLNENANHKDQNGELINSIQFEVYIHGGDKPKKYEFEDIEEYRQEMEGWRGEKRDLKNELERLKGVRGNLSEARLIIVKNSPIKQHWQN